MMMQAQKIQQEMAKRPLQQEPMKGKVDIKWYGHCGFKIQWKDDKDVQRVVYTDMWVDNKDCPTDIKKNGPPNDADLMLVTHGQLDHSMHMPMLAMTGKKPERKIVCNAEVGLYYMMMKKIPQQFVKKMQPGGTVDFGFCQITMVHAEHSSVCSGPNGILMPGGMANGFVITIPQHDIRIYHAGDTNIFSDMKLIDELYKPDIAMLPVGDVYGMGPKEAAYAAKHFLKGVKKFVPMVFTTFSECTGTVEAFDAECNEQGVEAEIIHPKNFLTGASVKD